MHPYTHVRPHHALLSHRATPTSGTQAQGRSLQVMLTDAPLMADVLQVAWGSESERVLLTLDAV